MTTLDGPVGLRNGRIPVKSTTADQIKIIGLLSNIRPVDGGQKGAWIPPFPGPDGVCPPALAAAILAFQKQLIKEGSIKSADGVVDPIGATIRVMDDRGNKLLIVPDGLQAVDTIDGIKFTEMNPPDEEALGVLPRLVLAPPPPVGRLATTNISGMFWRFLFKVEKDNQTYWVGVSVPPLTTDFTRLQVFLHPTPTQNGFVIASDGDFPAFKGGWRKVYRYMPIQGTQLAALRPMIMVVPFNRDACTNATSNKSVFATRPHATLNAIATAAHLQLARRIPIMSAAGTHRVREIGVTSYSSGVSFLRAFITQFNSTGLIRETLDLDSRFITSEHKKPLVRAEGARARWVSQSPLPNAPPGYFHISAERLAQIGDRTELPHSKLGFMTYNWMMRDAVVR
ncbi:hypothetical protein sos41_15850 [Alphaproteobacteria bacterium SO-S41]|nr:hypothetical protein sos41_15850 [Alphaproteobacteria bacterium SO-S41]